MYKIVASGWSAEIFNRQTYKNNLIVNKFDVKIGSSVDWMIEENFVIDVWCVIVARVIDDRIFQVYTRDPEAPEIRRWVLEFNYGN